MGRCVPWRPKCLRTTQLAREAWRSVKKNRVGLSFGYLVTDDLDRSDGVKELLAIDLFEITLTGVPANADARVLSTKSMQPIQVATFEC